MSSQLILFILVTVMPAVAITSPVAEPVMATVESSLETSGKQIRQFAFDGDLDTAFVSSRGPAASDHFTLVLDRALPLKSVVVTTGRPDGTDKLDSGTLEFSHDGQTFERVGEFAGGVAKIEANKRIVRSIRVRPPIGLAHPLVIREIALESIEAIAKFRYPIEFSVDTTDAPEMKEWSDKVARLCERWYPRINEELKSDGYTPSTQITMTLKASYKGVAAASGSRITGSVDYFKDHPEDLGAMIHETCHIVQRYRSRNNPGWLVEGVADYVRFFVFEPGKAGAVNPDRAHYNDSYRTTASFLAYVVQKYDKELVLKLNKLMRAGKYKEDVFQELTGKTIQELGEEWLKSLRK